MRQAQLDVDFDHGTGTTAAKFTGCMVTDTGGINDKSFNQASWAGMQAAAATSSNITVKYLPSTTTSDYAKNISTFIREKCGIIVTVGFLMGPATEAAAKANPKQKFAIVDCSYASDCLYQARIASPTSTSWCSTPCRTPSSAATWRPG